jgi:hypothetical protein
MRILALPVIATGVLLLAAASLPPAAALAGKFLGVSGAAQLQSDTTVTAAQPGPASAALRGEAPASASLTLAAATPTASPARASAPPETATPPPRPSVTPTAAPAVASATRPPPPSPTPDACGSRDAALRFRPAELSLRTEAEARWTLRLVNEGSGPARDVVLRVSSSGAGLRSLTHGGASWSPSAALPSWQIKIGAIKGGAEVELVFDGSFAFSASNTGALSLTAAASVDLLFEVVQESCRPALNASGKVFALVRVNGRLQPAVKPVTAPVLKVE